MGVQEFVNSRSAERRRQRGQRQMTLARLIAHLSTLPIGTQVESVCDFNSYRGYCEDLALAKGEGTMLASQLLKQCQFMVGQVFEGYKGGEFEMDEQTPIWVARAGELGPMLIAIDGMGQMVTASEDA